MNAVFPDADSQLLNEYATLEYILLGDLRDLLEEPLTQQNRTWLWAILDALLETLPREFSLREREGYLSEVLDQQPNWSLQVETLREERLELFRKLQELHAEISQRGSLARLTHDVRRELRDWMHRFIAHHRHERRLVQFAFNTDMGTGD